LGIHPGQRDLTVIADFVFGPFYAIAYLNKKLALIGDCFVNFLDEEWAVMVKDPFFGKMIGTCKDHPAGAGFAASDGIDPHPISVIRNVGLD